MNVGMRGAMAPGRFMRGLRAVAVAIACAAATAVAAPAEHDPAVHDAAAAARLDALIRDVGLAPAEVLHRLDALALDPPAEPLPIRDRARLIEIQALLDIGRVPDAERRAQAMLSDPSRRGDAMALVRAQFAMLRVRLRHSNIKDATPLARTILASRAAFENDPLAPELLATTGSALARAGDYVPAAQLYFDGIKAADRFDRSDQKAYILIGLCSLNYDMHNSARAMDYCRQGAAIADATGNKLARAAAAINLSLTYATVKDAKNQLAELEKSLALSKEMGLKRAEGMAQINLADYTMTRGDFKAGLEHCREGLRIGRELSDPIMIAVSLTNLGTATAQLGNVSDGIKLYQQGVKTAEDAGETAYVVDFLSGLADLYAQAGRMDDALKTMQRRVEEGDKLYETSQAEALAALQAKFDADNRQREIRLLTLDNRLKSAELARRSLQQRAAWLLGTVLVLGTILLIVAYRRLRRANRRLEVENVELEHHSLSDPLTGLFNRRALNAFIDPGELGHARRQPLPPMAFVMIDADRFKQINDRYGHSYGDAVLVELAHRLTRLVRPEDRLFRLGGEEFLLLLPGISNADLSRLCRRILLAVNSEPVAADDQNIAVTVSLGACRFPLADAMPFAQDWQRHLHLADLALYQAKFMGRNRACQILAIADGSEAMLEKIEADFANAQEQRWVEVVEIEGDADAMRDLRAEPAGAM
jgi:diguanylate cyclase (GGDEF)-like protein